MEPLSDNMVEHTSDQTTPKPEITTNESLEDIYNYFDKMARLDEKRRKRVYGNHGKLIWDSAKQGTYRKPK